MNLQSMSINETTLITAEIEYLKKRMKRPPQINLFKYDPFDHRFDIYGQLYGSSLSVRAASNKFTRVTNGFTPLELYTRKVDKETGRQILEYIVGQSTSYSLPTIIQIYP